MPVQAQHRFSVEEYYRMAETGILRPDARVELLEGKIIDMSPIGPLHGGLVNRLIRVFTLQSKGRWLVSAQNPVRLDDHSEPEPDLMLLKPTSDDYTSRHPRPEDVFLLIEVSETTLEYDRGEKLAAYGWAGIREVWIVNLPEQVIEAYREPHFTGYGSMQTLRAGDKAAPSAFPDAGVDIAELLGRTE
jgi:Uma2 family endonuclease